MSIKIALDAGHGLNTAGKETPTKIKEWTLNDSVRDKVVEFLADYDCEFIHVDNNEGKVDESLSSRRNAYINAGADVFVSIHHNGLYGTWNTATGVEVYVDRNNTEEDMKLAECIYYRLVEYTGLKARGIKKANFSVINQNKVPAILCEGGFMDGTNDYKYITTEEGQTAYAKAVADGLIEFLNLKKKEHQNATYKLEVDGKWGKSTTLATQRVYGTEEDGIISNQKMSYKIYLPNVQTTSWKFVLFTTKGSQLIKAIQTDLKEKGYYNGVIDGGCGKGTVTAIQKFLKDLGFYSGSVDSKMGSGTVKGWQMYINSIIG